MNSRYGRIADRPSLRYAAGVDEAYVSDKPASPSSAAIARLPATDRRLVYADALEI